MRRRVGLLMLSTFSFLVAHTAWSLGLGDITLKSNLNQTLNAEIEVLELRGLTKDEIIVNLAGAEDFDRLGVDRIYLLNDLKFAVLPNSASGPVIRVTSSRPVREPFLNFIVEARWPSGKLLREYTVLLDLPVFSDESAAPVSPVQTQTYNSPTTPSVAPAAPTETQANPRSDYAGAGNSAPGTTTLVRQSDFAAGDSYSVQKNDTLWEIALRVRPDSGVSVHKTMLALQRTNPDSFINGNINLLRSGVVLRVPSRDDIADYSQVQAVREVAEQNALWSGNLAAPLDASAVTATDSDTLESGEGRLTLVSPDDSADAAQGRISGSDGSISADVRALQTELATTQEMLDKSGSENTELRSKIDSLEEQIQTLESMIEISSEKLRAFELSTQQAREAEQALLADASIDDAIAAAEETGQQADDIYQPEPGEAPTDGTELATADELADESIEGIEPSDLYEDLPDADVALTEPLENTKLTPKPEPTPKPELTSAPVSAPAEQKGKSLLDQAIAYLPYIGGGVVVLLAGLFFLFKRKSSDDDFDDLLGGEHGYDEEPMFEESISESIDDDEIASDIINEDTEVVETDDSTQIKNEVAPEPQTEDVVAESDIYIAYGKYDQAEDMLSKALEKTPEHHEARVKLLEIYASQEKLKEFDHHYTLLIELHASRDKIDRVAELRSGFGGAEEFNAMGITSAVTEPEAEVTSEPSQEDELSFDLDLDLDLDEGLEEEIGLGNDDVDIIPEGVSADAGSLGESNDSLELSYETDDTFADSGDMSIDFDDLVEVDHESTEASPKDKKIDTDLYLDPDDLGADSEDDDVDLDLDLDLSADIVESGDSASTESDVLDTDFDLDGLDEIDIAKDLEDLELGLVEDGVSSSGGLSVELEQGLESIDSTLGDLEVVESVDSKGRDDGDTIGSSDFDLSVLDSELDELSSNLSADGIDPDALASEEFSESALEVSDIESFDLGDVDLEEQKNTDPDATQIREVVKIPESRSESLDFELPDIDPEASDDEDLDFLSSSDETETKLDLAAAYIDMGDVSGAKEIIDEVMKEGSETHKELANKLLVQIDD